MTEHEQRAHARRLRDRQLEDFAALVASDRATSAPPR